MEAKIKDLPGFTTSSGQEIRVRHLVEADAALLVDLFHHLSERTKWLRFHTYIDRLPTERIWQEAKTLSQLDPERQVALIAMIQDGDKGDQAAGVVRFSRATADDDEAEIAIVIRDDWQNMGLGTYLTFKLAQIARSMGIKCFIGWVLPENRQMLAHIFDKLGLPIEQEIIKGEMRLQIFIDAVDKLQPMIN